MSGPCLGPWKRESSRQQGTYPLLKLRDRSGLEEEKERNRTRELAGQEDNLISQTLVSGPCLGPWERESSGQQGTYPPLKLRAHSGLEKELEENRTRKLADQEGNLLNQTNCPLQPNSLPEQLITK